LENSPPNSISFEIKHLSALIGRTFDNQILIETGKDSKSENSCNVTIMQSYMIGFIYNRKDHTISQKELEKEFVRRRSTITGILKLMEKNGYITRKYSKTDARVKIVTLTDKAILLHKEIVCKIDTFNKNLEKGLTKEEIDSFYSIIGKIKKNLE